MFSIDLAACKEEERLEGACNWRFMIAWIGLGGLHSSCESLKPRLPGAKGRQNHLSFSVAKLVFDVVKFEAMATIA